MGLLRFLAGLLLVLWVMRLLRKAFAKPQQRKATGGKQESKFSGESVEEADYEELP